MVRVGERFLKQIIQLAKDGADKVDFSSAIGFNVGGFTMPHQGTLPGEIPDDGYSKFWIRDDGYAVLTDSDGNDVVIGSSTEFPTNYDYKYSVGPENTGAKYRTIQEAVDAAEADGTAAYSGRHVLVYPGSYIENVEVHGDGISIGGFTDKDFTILLYGSITFYPTTIADYTISNMFIYNSVDETSTILLTGSATGNVSLHVTNCNLLVGDGYTVDTESLTSGTNTISLYVNNSRFTSSANNSTRIENCNYYEIFDSILECPQQYNLMTIGGKNNSGQAFSSRNCRFFGTIIKNTTNDRVEFGNCIFEVEGTNPAIEWNSPYILRLCGSTLKKDGTPGPCIVMNNGYLDSTGNAFCGTGSAAEPVELNGSASRSIRSNFIEKYIGPYKFPESPVNIFTFPDTDGTSGQVLTTDGNGNLSFETTQTERLPTEAIFTEVYQKIWFDSTAETENNLQSLLWVDDDFTDNSTDRFTQITANNLGSLLITGGEATITCANGSSQSLFLTEGEPMNIPQLFTQVTATATTGSTSTYIYLGVILDGSNYISINWDLLGATIRFQIKVAGVSNYSSNISTSGWPSLPIKLGLSVVGNWFNIWSFYNDEWHLEQSVDVSAYIDFKAVDLTQRYPFFGLAGPGSGTITASFDDYKVGRFGGVGLRDLCVVTNEDGSAYTGLGTHTRYILATMAGPYGSITSASQGVFTFNTQTKELIQTSVIVVERDGKIQNDAAAHAIRHSDGSTRICMSTWGDLGTNQPMIRHELVPSTTDPFDGYYIMSSSDELALTELPVGGSNYDPFLIRKTDGYWYMAYTASGSTTYSFYPVLDRSTDLVTWENVGSDPSSLAYEGSRIVKFNNVEYALYGGRDYMKMYLLEDFSYVGLVNVLSPGTVGNYGTQPHAMIWPEQSTYWLLTFDPYTWPDGAGEVFSWGRIRLFASPRY